MAYSVLIVGAGQIAAGYDAFGSETILTHAHAVSINPNFCLLGFYDPDSAKAQSAADKWHTFAFNELTAADIIVVCTPDSAHMDNVMEAIALNPEIIILEKPIADSLESAEKILELSQTVPIQVNFTRRFVSEFQTLPSLISELGVYLTGTGLYGKGFIHNGSHMVDLLRLLIGEIKAIEIINKFTDYSPNDPTNTVRIAFENGGEFYMRGINCSHYTVFELELCFEKGRIKILDSGNRIQIERVKVSDTFAGYVNLALTNDYATSLDKAMINLYDNVFEHLQDGINLITPVSAVFSRELYIK